MHALRFNHVNYNARREGLQLLKVWTHLWNINKQTLFFSWPLFVRKGKNQFHLFHKARARKHRWTTKINYITTQFCCYFINDNFTIKFLLKRSIIRLPNVLNYLDVRKNPTTRNRVLLRTATVRWNRLITEVFRKAFVLFTRTVRLNTITLRTTRIFAYWTRRNSKYIVIPLRTRLMTSNLCQRHTHYKYVCTSHITRHSVSVTFY